MKKLLIILFLFCACQKEQTPEPEKCITCTENVVFIQYGQYSNEYIGSITEYCNDEWKSQDGKYWEEEGWSSGEHWKRTHKITCQ